MIGILYADIEAELSEFLDDDADNNSYPVKFSSWLARNPKQPFKPCAESWQTKLWSERSFYPDIQAVANDLHRKGLLKAGEYLINIDW